MCAEVLNNKIYVIGGLNSGWGTTTNVYMWDGASWTEVEGLPISLARSTSAVYSNKIWILGGYSGSALKSVYSYDGTNFTAETDLPIERYSGQAAVLSNKLYYIGGENGGGQTNVYVYDGGVWNEVIGLPESRYNGKALTMDSKIYVVNGDRDMDNDTQIVHVFDGVTWTTNAMFPVARDSTPATLMNNNIYSFYDTSYASEKSVITNITPGQVITNLVSAPDGLPIYRYQDSQSNTVFQILTNRLEAGSSNTYDLGSLDKPFKEVYIGQGSMKLGSGVKAGTNRMWFSYPPYSTTNWPLFE
jgi:N-acetylneuraminic acid mutarotase